MTAVQTATDTILEVNNLKTYIFTRAATVKAVDGISFDLKKGETLGIVGESGCGKTMTALSLLRLVPRPAGRIVEGEIVLNGEDILQKSEDEMRDVRGRQIFHDFAGPADLAQSRVHHRQPVARSPGHRPPGKQELHVVAGGGRIAQGERRGPRSGGWMTTPTRCPAA